MDLLLGTLISVVTGVVVGISTWRVSAAAMRKDELRRIKRDALTALAANRFDLVGDEFTRALNSTAVVFDSSPSVRVALFEFHRCTTERAPEAETGGALLALLRSMFNDLGLEHGDLSDDFLLRPFNVRPSSALPAPDRGRGSS